MVITEADIYLENSISPWIYLSTPFDGNWRIGMWQLYDKSIHFDYSMKWIFGSNESIKCEKHEIKSKILKFINV